MNAKEFLFKAKPIIIIILLFSIVFLLRANAVYISGVPDDMKSFYQDQSGQPYFSEMDSYYNYRFTQDYLDHGYLGDAIVNGTQWDYHSYYPEGRSAEYPPLIVYITAFVYKLLNLFTTVPLTTVCIWIAPFIASLCVIPAYLFISRLTNDYGGIAAALLVGTAYAYFAHTFAGFFDTDMFNVLFPILIVWFFVESIRADSFKNRSIFVILSAISIALFSMAWEGWWYMFYLIVAVGVFYVLISNYIFKMKTIKPFKDYSDKITWFKDQNAVFALVVFIIISSILLILHLGISGFFGALASPFAFQSIQSAVQGTAYPNVYISVSELQIPSFGNIATGVGIGSFIFGILCVPLLILKFKPDLIKSESKTQNKVPKRKTKPRRRRKRSKSEVKEESTPKPEKKVIEPEIMKEKMNYLLYIILFTIWILAVAYMVTKGSRFLEAFSIPMGLAAGVSIGLLAPYVSKHIKNVKYCAVVMLVIVAAVSAPSLYAAYGTSSIVVPGTDDGMYNSLDYLKNTTSNNTVITSWWDFGYLFESVADRPVTFDGGSQNTPRAYWVGKAFLTDNEALSAGILRMLTTSGDQGTLLLENYTKNTGKSVEILDKILPVSKQNAQTILISQYNFTPEQAQNILKYTHPDNPNPHVLVTSSDMLGKAAWWSYFGSWNFQNGTGQHYVYSAAPASSQSINGSTVISAQNGVVAKINDNNITAGLNYAQGSQTQLISPHRLTVVVNNRVVQNNIVSSDSPISIFLIIQNNSGLAIVMNKELENSMFTRLFIFGGAGLTKFKMVEQQPGVMVWNVSPY